MTLRMPGTKAGRMTLEIATFPVPFYMIYIMSY